MGGKLPEKEFMDAAKEQYAVDSSFPLLVLSLTIVLGGTVLLIYFSRRSLAEIHTRQPAARPRPAAALQRPGLQRPRRVQLDEEEDESDGEDYEQMESIEDNIMGSRASRIKMRKLEQKEEKRRQREAMEAEREERKRAEEAKRLAREEAEREEEEEEARLAREAAEAEEARKRAEHELYLQLKGDFQVEEEGYDHTTEEEAQDLLRRFLAYIHTHKVVSVDAVASEFNLRSADCVNRLKSLQESEQLTGVLDDRGKFIFVTEDEMTNLARFINTRGRISINELARSCTAKNIISLKGQEIVPQEETPVECS